MLMAQHIRFYVLFKKNKPLTFQTTFWSAYGQETIDIHHPDFLPCFHDTCSLSLHCSNTKVGNTKSSLKYKLQKVMNYPICFIKCNYMYLNFFLDYLF